MHYAKSRALKVNVNENYKVNLNVIFERGSNKSLIYILSSCTRYTNIGVARCRAKYIFYLRGAFTN